MIGDITEEIGEEYLKNWFRIELPYKTFLLMPRNDYQDRESLQERYGEKTAMLAKRVSEFIRSSYQYEN